MAARKKASKRKASAKRKPATRKAAPRKKAVRQPTAPRRARQLPNDDAWRELVETAIEKPDPDVRAVAPRRKSK